MYPRYQWLWKAKQPATQTTRHAICAMLKHPKVTDAFLFPLQSMFFDSLRMDRLSTAVWIDEDRCCQVVQIFFLPAIWALSQEVWASTKHHYLQRCFGCSWQGQKVGRQLSILAKGWLQSHPSKNSATSRVMGSKDLSFKLLRNMCGLLAERRVEISYWYQTIPSTNSAWKEITKTRYLKHFDIF